MSTTIAQNAFLPTQVPGIQLWLDAADPSTITGTSPVTAWRDKSGNGNNGTASGSPVVLANSINGSYPSIYFDGASSIAGATVNSGTTLTAFCILQTTDANLNTNGRLLSLSAPGRNDYDNVQSCIPYDQFNGAIINTNRGNTGSVGVLYNVPVGTSALLATIFDGNTSNIFYANGSLQFTSTAASWNQSFSITTYCIGNAINPNSAWYKGRIGEIILFNTAVTTFQRQQVEGYLAQKWGLQTSLPPNHPYRYSAYFTNQAYISTNISPMITNRFTNASFNPANIAACLLWLDGADPAGTGVIPANGSTLTTWKDKSPTGNNMTVTAGTLTYTRNPYSVSFPDAQVTCTSALSTNVVTAGSSCIFIVVQDTYINPTTFGYAFTCVNINDYSLRFQDSPTNLRVSPTGDIGANYYVNGTLASPGGLYGNIITVPAGYNVIDGTFTVSGTTQFGLSQPNGGNRYFTGNIQEVILYSGPITTAQQQQVEGYLAWKWGLVVNLASNFPYKKTSAVFVTQPSTLAALAANPYNNMTVYGTFNPKNIPGCQLWLDGADPAGNGIVPANGATVSTWKDKSGNGRDGTATGAPTYSRNVLNTLGSPLLSNSISYFTTPSFVASSTGAPTFFVVMKQTSYTGVGVNSDFFMNTSDYHYFDMLGQGNSYNVAIVIYGSDQTPITANNVTNLNATFFSIVGTTAQNAAACYTNGSLYTTTSGSGYNLTTSLPYRLGSGPGFNGYVYEALIYNSPLSTSQRQQVEGYLAWKWGLQGSLPSTHAYKSFPPSP